MCFSSDPPPPPPKYVYENTAKGTDTKPQGPANDDEMRANKAKAASEVASPTGTGLGAVSPDKPLRPRRTGGATLGNE